MSMAVALMPSQRGRSTSPTSPINGSTGRLSGKSPVPSPRKGTYVTRTSRLIWRARGSSASRRTIPTMGSQSIRWLRSRWTPCDGVIADPEVLVSGSDFYSSPRLSPDGSWLCWLSWNHPNMPWDGTELWVGELDDDGKIGQRKLVAGGAAESICQPEWAPDGRLYFVSDRSGWWNLYRWDNRTGRGAGECVLPMQAEFGRPQWVFGANAYGFVSADRAICAVNRSGVWELLDVDLESGRWTRLDIGGYSAMGRSDLRVVGDSVFFEAGGPTEPNALLRLDLESGRLHVVRRSNPAPVDPEYLSAPETIEFPTEERVDGPRVLLSAPEPGLYGTRGSQATVAAEEPRRSHGSRRPTRLTWRSSSGRAGDLRLWT